MVNPKPYADAGLPEEKSFFSLDGEDIIISTIKKAEDDQSVVIRMFDIKGESRTVNLNHDFNFNNAVSTSLVEENIRDIQSKKNQTKINIGHHAIETVKLK